MQAVNGRGDGGAEGSSRFARTPENTRTIYNGVAQQGLVLPVGFPTFEEHAFRQDSSTKEPVVYVEPHVRGGG